MSKIINCKEIRENLLNKYKGIDKKGKSIAIIQIGDREDSNRYIKNKIKTLEECGFKTELVKLPEDVHMAYIIFKITLLNKNDNVCGIIMQLPLPDNLKEYEDTIISFIDYKKDLDRITPRAEQDIYLGKLDILPCTVSGIIHILEERFKTKDFRGINICIIGRSRIVGKPLAMALIHKNATVTVCNSSTQNLEYIMSANKVIISATGCKDVINEFNLKPYHTVIDVGINFDDNGKLRGDMSPLAQNIVENYTSVPGGVGVLTTAEVVGNAIKLIK